MGKKGDADYFRRRATGWPASFNKDLGLILPKKADGEWLHTDPLSGNGYVEANAWQATFGISHAIPVLAKMMGVMTAFAVNWIMLSGDRKIPILCMDMVVAMSAMRTSRDVRTPMSFRMPENPG